MNFKKIICVICAFLIFVSGNSVVLAFSWDDFLDNLFPPQTSDMSQSCHENKADIDEILGTDVVFMTSVGCFYSGGVKQNYSDIGAADAYYENGNVMIDYKVAEHIFKSNIPQLEKVSKNGTDFVSVSSLGDSLGKYVYDTDNRYFAILSDSDKGYSNYVVSKSNQENTDKIWRYMQFDRPDGDKLYTMLTQSEYYQKHPRLFVKYDEIDSFKSSVYSNESLKKTLDTVIQVSDSILMKEPQEYKIGADGFRLFNACSTIKDRLFNLCLAYMLTNDTSKKEQYAQRAWEEIDNACSWKDWNVDVHLLDSGQIGPGIAFAYDILYDWLGSERRQTIRNKVTDLYLNECVDMYTGDSEQNLGAGSKNLSSNWGAVNGTSMFMMSITFMDEESADSELTRKCKYIAANSLQTYEHILTSLAPDGTWCEGAEYYEYVEQHLAWLLKIFSNIFNNAGFNKFLSVPGVDAIVEYAMYTNTFNGSFNKSATTGSPKYFAPEAFVYAKMYGRNDLMNFYKNYRESIGVTSYPTSYLLFYEPLDSELSMPDLDKYFSGNGTGVMRGTWFNHNGTYTAISGGVTSGTDDAHYDKGSFIFEADGERWSIDLGRNSNNTMPFLYRTETHSALTINPTAQNMGQVRDVPAKLIYSQSKAKAALMVYDLEDVYSDWVSNYKRGFLLGDNRNTLTIRDELVLNEDNPIVWNMVTKAEIEISSDGKSAILIQNGKKLAVSALCSEDGWKFVKTEDMAPTGGWVATEDDGDNDPTDFFTVEQQKKFASGAKKLCIVANGSGDVAISVKLTPVIEDETFRHLEDIPISEWALPDGELEHLVRFTNIADGDVFLSNKPIYFSINLDGDFSNLKISVDDKLVTDITECNLSRVYDVVIPSDFCSLAGEYLLTANATYPTYSAEKSIRIIINEVHDSDSVFNLDFENLTETWASYNELKSVSGLDLIELKAGQDGTENARISKEKGLTGTGTAMKLSLFTNSVTPYIQKYLNAFSNDDIINISFDIIANATDIRLYTNFIKDESGYNCNILRNNGTFLDTGVKYQPNTLYHVDFIIDYHSGLYMAIITDSQGNLVVQEKSSFDKNYGYKGGYSRLAFSTLHSGGEDRYIILDNYALSHLKYTLVQVDSVVSDSCVISVDHSIFSNKYDLSKLTSYIAYYDSENTLISVITPDITSGDISVSDILPNNTKYAKLMIWGNDVNPVCRTFNIYSRK